MAPASPRNVRRLNSIFAAIAVSGASQLEWCSSFPALETRTIVIHNGVDLRRFQPVSAQERLRLRRELGFGPDDYVIGFVGRIEQGKGVLDLAEAAARASVTARFRLVFVGGRPGKDLSGELAQLCPFAVYPTNRAQDVYSAIDLRSSQPRGTFRSGRRGSGGLWYAGSCIANWRHC